VLGGSEAVFGNERGCASHETGDLDCTRRKQAMICTEGVVVYAEEAIS